MKQLFLTLYNQAFDENDEQRLSGRYICMQLIKAADQIEPNVYHGNETTGMMNIEAIKSLKRQITKL